MRLLESLPPEKKTEAYQLIKELGNYQKLFPLLFHDSLPMQGKFSSDGAKKKFLFGGNRSGKTECGAAYVNNKCTSKNYQRWWCVSETFQDSVNIQQRKIWNLAPKLEINYGKYDEINGFTNRKLQFKNRSLITFKSYDQGVDSFRSDDIDGVWFDEEPPLEIYKETLMRLIDRDGEVIITMTSLKGITELLEEIFQDHDVFESQYAPLIKRDVPRVIEKNGVRIYFLWTTDNPHIDQSRMDDEAKLLTYQEKAARIYGLPMNLSGKIYPSFNRDVHVIKFDDLPDGRYSLYNIIDPHDRKPWAIIWLAVHITGSLYVVDEYPSDRNFNELLFDDKTYDDYARLVKEHEDVLKDIFNTGIQKRICDPNFGNKTVQLAERQGGQAKTTPIKELKKRGLYYKDGIDALEAGHLKVRELLQWEAKDGEIVVQPKLFVLDSCLNTIRHLSRYSRKDIMSGDGDEKDKVKPMDKYKDFCDCVRYAAMADLRYITNEQLKMTLGKVY